MLSADSSKAELNVAIPDVAPFGYLEDGELKGIYHRIFTNLEKESGIKFIYTLYPYARLKTSLISENPDLVILFAPVCEQHKPAFEIQKHLQRLTLSIFLKAKADVKSKDLRVARVRGTCLGFMNDTVKPENIIDVSDFKQALSMIELGRAEGVCALNLVLNYNEKKHPEFTEKLTQFKTQGPVAEFEAVLCGRKNIDQTLKKKLEKALKHVDTRIDNDL